MRVVLTLVSVALAGCASSRPSHPVPAYAGAPLRVPYYCESAPGIAATFRERDVVIERTGLAPLTLPQREAPSGFWFGSANAEFRGLGYEAFWSQGRDRPVRCHAYRPRPRRGPFGA